MSSPMRFVLSTKKEDYFYLEDKITTEGAQKSSLPKVKSYSLQAINTKNEILGGLAGYEFYGSFVIEILWVDPSYRKKGIGSRLLQQLEKTAKEKGLLFLSVSTMEWWDSNTFYEKNGFKLEFVRKGFANGFKQYHFIKKIPLVEKNES